MDQGASPARVTLDTPVWDRGVRAFHWLLAAAVAGGAYTGFFDKRLALRLHLILGVAVMVLVAFRLVWGFLGGSYARFASFVPSPRALIEHLRRLGDPHPARHLGHNPLGALMVLGLLCVLAAIAATGTVALGGFLKQGPLAPFTSFATGQLLLQVHKALAILLVAMVVAHLAGVAFESWRQHENLVGAMLTGRKRVLPPAEQAAPVRPHPRAAAAVLAATVAAGGAGVALLAARPGLGVPPARLDPTYVADCGACHMAYPPELLPAPSWSAIMADLSHHFGEDASLGPRDTAAIAAWLRANAATRWDTLPAHLFRTVDPAKPTLITATPAWRRLHRAIPAAVFRQQPVVSAANCGACHRDAASGRFAPQQIVLPRGVKA